MTDISFNVLAVYKLLRKLRKNVKTNFATYSFISSTLHIRVYREIVRGCLSISQILTSIFSSSG